MWNKLSQHPLDQKLETSALFSLLVPIFPTQCSKLARKKYVGLRETNQIILIVTARAEKEITTVKHWMFKLA